MSTAGNTFLEAFLLPHIRKYMMRKLNPATAPTTPNAQRIQEDVAAMLPLRAVHCEPERDQWRPIQRLRLAVVFPDLRDLDPTTSRRLNQYAEEAYLHEFCSVVDRLVYEPPGMERLTAIAFFREQYGITEEDLLLETSRRCYWRYELRKGRTKRRGGARGRSGPLVDRSRPHSRGHRKNRRNG